MIFGVDQAKVKECQAKVQAGGERGTSASIRSTKSVLKLKSASDHLLSDSSFAKTNQRSSETSFSDQRAIRIPKGLRQASHIDQAIVAGFWSVRSSGNGPQTRVNRCNSKPFRPSRSPSSRPSSFCQSFNRCHERHTQLLFVSDKVLLESAV